MAEKAYRIAVLVLLAGLLGVQLWQMRTKPPNEACDRALESAAGALRTTSQTISDVASTYEEAVYRNAEDMEERMFRVAEYQFWTQQAIGQQNSAILAILAACE